MANTFWDELLVTTSCSVRCTYMQSEDFEGSDQELHPTKVAMKRADAEVRPEEDERDL